MYTFHRYSADYRVCFKQCVKWPIKVPYYYWLTGLSVVQLFDIHSLCIMSAYFLLSVFWFNIVHLICIIYFIYIVFSYRQLKLFILWVKLVKHTIVVWCIVLCWVWLTAQRCIVWWMLSIFTIPHFLRGWNPLPFNSCEYFHYLI